MADYAVKHNLTPFISMQNHYNLLYREEEREMFPALKVSIHSYLPLAHEYSHEYQMLGVGSIPWSPLAKGLLTRPLSAQGTTVRGKVDL